MPFFVEYLDEYNEINDIKKLFFKFDYIATYAIKMAKIISNYMLKRAHHFLRKNESELALIKFD